jgi:nucleoside-diphosphate-sugar epimerase
MPCPYLVATTIFLTGSSGFLGRHLLQELIDAQYRVRCLGRTRPPDKSPHVDFVEGDLLDFPAYRKTLAGCDAVVHLAAATGKRAPADYYRVNRDGTKTLINEARRAGVARFCHVSTIAAKFSDISHYHYAQSKLQAEAIVASSGLRWIIVRPTMIFGPGAPVLEGLKKLSALPIVPLFGSGRALVQPISVDDLARALLAIVRTASMEGIVEIGGPEIVRMDELLFRMRRSLGIANQRVLRLPAVATSACLAALEPIFRRWMPVTAGQLASFTNDGTTKEDERVLPWRLKMHGINEMLEAQAQRIH